MLHARTLAAVEWDGRVVRQNVHARLCSRSLRCKIGPGATPSVVRGLEGNPFAASRHDPVSVCGLPGRTADVTLKKLPVL
jgi:hypothetical protein